MDCSVVIPCHNGAALTRSCLQSLLDQSGGHRLEILLVDNASTDTTAELAHLDPRITVLRQPTNRGFAGGVNQGLRHARHPFLLVLNNDTQAAPNLLDELAAALASDPELGAVAPVSNHVKGPACVPVGDLGRDAAQRAAIAATLSTAALVEHVDTLAGLCLLLPRRSLDRIGLLDERFGHGNYEDDDFCLRLRRHGLRLGIARRAFLHHEGHATFKALGIELRDELVRRRAQFTAKWQGDPVGDAVLAGWRGDLLAAAAAARDALRSWPNWADAHAHLARGAAACGDHRTAVQQWRALLRACPHQTEAALELAVSLTQLGDHGSAEVILQQLTAGGTLSATRLARTLGRAGEAARGRGEPAFAVAWFRAAIAADPDDGGLHNWLGVVELERGEFAAAAAALDTAIARGSALAHTNRGICHYRRGAPLAALADFQRAVELLPQDPIARTNRDALVAALGQPAPAAG